MTYTIITCDICDKKAKWKLSTQFTGNLYFCKEHAKREVSYKQNDSYETWIKIQRKGDSK